MPLLAPQGHRRDGDSHGDGDGDGERLYSCAKGIVGPAQTSAVEAHRQSRGVAAADARLRVKAGLAAREARDPSFATNAHAARCRSLLRVGDRAVSRMSGRCKHESGNGGLDGSVAP